MRLVKECVDIAVATNNPDEMLAFWIQDAGLPYGRLLEAGGGIYQHRLRLKGCAFKMNHLKDPLPENSPSGFHRLYIASDVDEAKNLQDPDGSLVTLVPEGSQGITHIGIGMKVRSLPKAQVFLRDTLQAEDLGDNRFRIGTTLFLLEQAAPNTPAPNVPGGPMGKGYRYLTIQVHDIDAEHEGLLARGAQEVAAPRSFQNASRISFVTDTEGNSVEVLERLPEWELVQRHP